MAVAKQISLIDRNQNPLRHSGEARILVHSIHAIELVYLSDILAIEATGNYSKFHMQDGTCLCACKTLKFYEKKLTGRYFHRIHNSWLINLEKLRKVVKEGSGVVVLENGISAPVSRSRKQTFLDYIGALYL